MRHSFLILLALFLTRAPALPAPGCCAAVGAADSITVFAGGAFVKNGGICLDKNARSLGDFVRSAGGLTLLGNGDFFLFQRAGKTVKVNGAYKNILLENGDFIFAPELIIPTE